MGERSRLPGRRRRPARAAAQRRRVEGHRPGTRRRGGAHRPPGRPRVPRQLQVPVRHPLQCLSLPRVRRSPRRRPRQPIRPREAAGRRLVRRGGAGGVRGALRRSPPGRARFGPHRARVGRGEDPSTLHRVRNDGRRGVTAGPRRRWRRHGRRCRPPQCRPAPRRAAQSADAGRAAVLRAARGTGRVAASGVARVHQGALRPVVRGRGQRVGPALGAGHGGAGRQRRGHPVAAPAHGRGAVLRPGLVGHPLAPPAHRHGVGLAPAVPAALPHDGSRNRGGNPGSRGRRWCGTGCPTRCRRSRGTSRSAGATGASAGHPKRRATWTRLITSCRGITPCDDRVRPHRLHAAAAAAAAGLPTGRAPALPRLGSGPGPPGLGRSTHPVDLVRPPPLQRRRRAGVHRAPAPAGHRGSRVLLRHRRRLRADSRPRVHRAVAARNRERAGLDRLLAGRRRPWTWLGRARAPDPGVVRLRGNWPSPASTSTWSPGTSHRRARPRPPGSPARRRCEDGSASMASSTTPTATPSSARSGPPTADAAGGGR